MEVQSQARAEPAGNRDQRSRTEAMRSVGKLKHAGFAESQTRAMAEFVEELVDGTVRPIVQRMDQRFEKVDLRFNQVDQRLDQVDQRLEQVDQQFERVNWRLDRMEGWMKQIQDQFQMVHDQFQMATDQIRDLADSVRRLQSRPWLPYLIIGLAFSGLYIAAIGVLLVLLSKPFG